MLTICITPTALYFDGLTDEIYVVIKDLFPELEEDNKLNKIGYMIKGNPEKLYAVLLKLTYTYDIEII